MLTFYLFLFWIVCKSEMFMQVGSNWPDPLLFSSTANHCRTVVGLIMCHKVKEEVSLSLKLYEDKNKFFLKSMMEEYFSTFSFW